MPDTAPDLSPAPAHFYFDLSSPYGYFAALKIDELLSRFDREVIWHPIMIGAVFKETGSSPLKHQPLKWEYSLKDMHRLARFMEVPFVLPDSFPSATLASSRAFYWINQTNPKLAKTFALACYEMYFGQGKDIIEADAVAEIGSGLGCDKTELLEAIQNPEIKNLLKIATSDAIEQGVCGSPYFIIDGESFWGADRLWMIRRWLTRGGW